jgi:hypothetical protein
VFLAFFTIIAFQFRSANIVNNLSKVSQVFATNRTQSVLKMGDLWSLKVSNEISSELLIAKLQVKT